MSSVTVLLYRTLKEVNVLYDLIFICYSLSHTFNARQPIAYRCFQNFITRSKHIYFLIFPRSSSMSWNHKQGISVYPGPISFQILPNKTSMFSLFIWNLTEIWFWLLTHHVFPVVDSLTLSFVCFQTFSSFSDNIRW